MLLRGEGWRHGGDRSLTYSDSWIKGWEKCVNKDSSSGKLSFDLAKYATGAFAWSGKHRNIQL